ncbi:PucR family transcriptional regulator ligand-binding domain-containing protein [Streptomyces sp. NBC_00078]|uniref:PucR family transcriptional regulator n=1 Tax=unclassified Streptomyces TaxID=2593676 RepID=UPI00224E0AFA|nr:PucR family transcriptional regulator ligand-binding domain-containing protein [Streptomyces sp. NBC_00078]MCX5424307.1 PucR family transcriptional regulator ligand-binding domain-containing protein [Streptomyces sp. NBC_00078]
MNDHRTTAHPPRTNDPGAATAGHTPTVADVLALPVLAAGQPRVVTGVTHLDRPVRWVHITELTDPASFLKGGELVLTTGMPLPDDPAGVRRYVDELADVPAAALVIELVRRYHRPPDALVHACHARGLPLIALAKDVNFLEVTQVVHSLILGNQAEAMRRTQRIHEAFTTLTLRGAGPEEVMRAAAEMSGHTVVLENLMHQALMCEPSGNTVEEVLRDWEERSRQIPFGAGTSGTAGWLVAAVEYQGERWGRVVMLPAGADGPAFAPEPVTVLERTAMALTVARLIHPTPWERTAHRNALQDLAGQRHRSPEDARARVAALGLPTEDRRYRALLVDLPTADKSTVLEGRLSQELRAAGAQALVGELAPGRLGILLALRPTQPWRPAVEQVGSSTRALVPQAIVTVGSEVTDLRDSARSFHEAARVAEATPPGQPLPPDRSFHELSDIGLRRLLYALREDTRIQDYAERRLGRLIDHDFRHGSELLTTLRLYLDAAGNKTTAARRGGLSRETVYQRLRTIERLLDCDLESGENCTELHVALTALDVFRFRADGGQGSNLPLGRAADD